MDPSIHSENRLAIVYDADRVPSPGRELFDPAHWEASGAVTGRAAGRGTTLFLATPIGPAVLRPYLRGGWPARLSADRYFFTGLNRSRGFREFHLLRRLSAAGLPVPAPLAASCEHGLLTCRGAILMELIPGATSLQELLGELPANSQAWNRAGSCIHDFHRAGVRHADLNAGNLLIRQEDQKVFLVDFDRCSYSPGKMVDGARNLSRLKRSLAKWWPADSPDTLEDCWRALEDGYRG